MSNQLMELTNTLAKKLEIGSSEGLVTTLTNTVFKNANPDQLVSLLIVANQYKLNPWTKEIYAFPDKNNGIVPVVGVDGWSRIINSHPQFDGIDFEQDDESCTCIIYRKDRNHPVKVTEFLSECKREPFKTKTGYVVDTPWQSHPKRMLRHKAMIQCARLAFGFAGIYDPDEAERVNESSAPQHSEQEIDNSKKQSLIADCENAAKNGEDAFKSHWLNLSVSDKKLIGEEEKNRIKESCNNVVTAEFVEVIEDDNPF